MDRLLLLGLSMGFAGGSTRVLWVEKAPLKLQILWFWRCVFGFFPKPESNFIPGSSLAPPISHGNAVLVVIFSPGTMQMNAVPRLPLARSPTPPSTRWGAGTLPPVLGMALSSV